MIRIGLPPPVWPRLRVSVIGVQTQAARHRRALRAARERFRASVASWRQRTARRLAMPFLLRVRARNEERLMAFEDRYEALVALLCWAAHEGVVEGGVAEREARYRELRTWMRAHYAGVRPSLLPHWHGAGAGPGRDPFEALFAPESMAEVINAPDGIEVMMRTRAALEAYRASLPEA